MVGDGNYWRQGSGIDVSEVGMVHDSHLLWLTGRLSAMFPGAIASRVSAIKL